MAFEKNNALISLINNKGKLNKDVTDITLEVFTQLKKVLFILEKTLKQNITDNRIKIRYQDRSSFESEFSIGDDVLIFIMHTNAFVFEPSNPVNNTGYVTNDNSVATCGMISIYNFLADSFQYERKNDTGVLVARLFVNKEKHFFLEGKKHLGVLFSDFANDIIAEDHLIKIVEESIKFSILMDPFVPPFESMKEISVNTAIEYSLQASIASGKRLGFKFEKDADDTQVS